MILMRKILDFCEKIKLFKSFINIIWALSVYMLPILSACVVSDTIYDDADLILLAGSVTVGIIVSIWAVVFLRNLDNDPDNKKKRKLYKLFFYIIPFVLAIIVTIVEMIVCDNTEFEGFDGLVIIVVWIFCGISAALCILGFIVFAIVCRIRDKRKEQGLQMQAQSVRKIHDVLHSIVLVALLAGLIAGGFLLFDSIESHIRYKKMIAEAKANKAYETERLEEADQDKLLEEAWLTCELYHERALGTGGGELEEIFSGPDTITSVSPEVIDQAMSDYKDNLDTIKFFDDTTVSDYNFSIVGDSAEKTVSIAFETLVVVPSGSYLGCIVAVYDENWELTKIYVNSSMIRYPYYVD